MSQGLIHNEGRLVINQMMGLLASPDRGNNLQLCLFTACASRSINSVLADFTEPTGGGYARVELPPSAMTASGIALSTINEQRFIALSPGYSGGPSAWVAADNDRRGAACGCVGAVQPRCLQHGGIRDAHSLAAGRLQCVDHTNDD